MGVIEKVIDALVEDVVDFTLEAAKGDGPSDSGGPMLHSRKSEINLLDSEREEDYVTDTIKATDTLRCFEALLYHEFACENGQTMRTDQLLQMSGVPFDTFLSVYMRDRDSALNTTKHCRREIVQVCARGIDMLQHLCGYLETRIDANEQLWFRMFMILTQLLSVVVTYTYEYLQPPAQWMVQIGTIFEKVSNWNCGIRPREQ